MLYENITVNELVCSNVYILTQKVLLRLCLRIFNTKCRQKYVRWSELSVGIYRAGLFKRLSRSIKGILVQN